MAATQRPVSELAFTEPSGPPSPLAPLSDTTSTIVFYRRPASSR